MKNAVILILALIALVAGYVAATSKLRLSLEGLEGKTQKLIRGDLTLPINATGEVLPHRRIVIKSEASGEVLEVFKHPGDRVASGDLLIRLEPDEEERFVERARLDSEVAKARWEEAKIAYKQAQTADLEAAIASVEQLEAAAEYARFRKEKLEALPEYQRNDEELVERDTTYRRQLAQLANARAALAKVKLAVPRAEQMVLQAAATYESTTNLLRDAEKRLRETDIVAPVNGVVGEVYTQVGEVIQGGKTTITGGTQLAIVLDLARLLVRAEVDEADIGRVLDIAPHWARPGHAEDARMPDDLQAAMISMEHPPLITVESFRDEEFSGIIERIYPEPKKISGVVTYLVDVVILSENADRLLPGMRADVRFTSEHVENVVLCPNEAIREGPTGELGVYIPKASTAENEWPAEFLVCKFGLDNGNYSEVRQGLDEGDTVYTKLPAKKDRDKD
ncbi:MAG: HlyD family efflux transporter periplasmic adaptor subunit [Phycisphaerae bacterium]|jgi:multidrug efflux pump subunit AcrA (membrane-fusion protein)